MAIGFADGCYIRCGDIGIMFDSGIINKRFQGASGGGYAQVSPHDAESYIRMNTKTA